MLRIERVAYEIKGRKLVKDISLQIRKGEVVALLGSNGAGKSTLMRLISGELTCSEGSINFNNQDISTCSTRDLAKSRAMLSQQQSINMAFTVRELVIMGRYPHFSSSASVRDWEIVEETMQVCGVNDFADRSYLTLSGGEQQRVQLARVLSQVWDNPNSLLLLDEPISALDLHYQQKVLAIAKALSRRGMMVVVVLHDINMASLYADRIVMLKNGRKWLEGNPMEVLTTKDIYTVFSVESTVNMDVTTLKPRVAFKEMEFRSEEFNTMLPLFAEGHEKLAQQMLEIKNKQPHLKYYDLAKMLNRAEIDILQSDKSNQIAVLSDDISEIKKILSVTDEITIITHHDGFELQTTHRDHHVVFDNGNIEFHDKHGKILQAFSTTLGSFILQNPINTSICFHEDGNMLFQIIINEQSEAIIRSLLDKQQQTFQSIIRKEIVSNKKQIIASGRKRISVEVLKKAIAHASKEQVEIQIYQGAKSYKHSYRGTIQHIIDQGEYYILRSPDLRCTWCPDLSDVIVIEENESDMILRIYTHEKLLFNISIPISTTLLSMVDEIQSEDRTNYLEQL